MFQDNFNNTRANVRENLSAVEDILPLSTAFGTDGLRLSEIKTISNSVLRNSLNITSDNERLSKWQVVNQILGLLYTSVLLCAVIAVPYLFNYNAHSCITRTLKF